MSPSHRSKWSKVLDGIMIPLMLAGVIGIGGLALNINYKLGCITTQQTSTSQDIADIKDEVKGFSILKITVAQLQQRVDYLDRALFNRNDKDNE